MIFSDLTTLRTDLVAGVLTLTLHRPAERNAMNETMLNELLNIFTALADNNTVRVLVLRGTAGHFCAGGDIQDFARLRRQPAQAGEDLIAQFNRRFGAMLEALSALPQPSIAVLEGAVLGGGLGLACVADVSIAHQDSNFGMPEVGLGIFPAQIAPFVVQRCGLSQARRLALCGSRFDGHEAVRLGVAHFVEADSAALEQRLAQTVQQLLRGAPAALAATKQVLAAVGQQPLSAILDNAALQFSAALQSEEAAEGTRAFIEKRLPLWAQGV